MCTKIETRNEIDETVHTTIISVRRAVKSPVASRCNFCLKIESLKQNKRVWSIYIKELNSESLRKWLNRKTKIVDYLKIQGNACDSKTLENFRLNLDKKTNLLAMCWLTVIPTWTSRLDLLSLLESVIPSKDFKSLCCEWSEDVFWRMMEKPRNFPTKQNEVNYCLWESCRCCCWTWSEGKVFKENEKNKQKQSSFKKRTQTSPIPHPVLSVQRQR